MKEAPLNSRAAVEGFGQALRVLHHGAPLISFSSETVTIGFVADGTGAETETSRNDVRSIVTDLIRNCGGEENKIFPQTQRTFVTGLNF